MWQILNQQSLQGYYYKTRLNIWREFCDFSASKGVNVEYDGISFHLVYSYIEQGPIHLDKSKQNFSAKIRATHLKKAISFYCSPPVLDVSKAVLLDTFLDSVDAVTKSKIKKHSNAINKFKRESQVKHTDLFDIVLKFFKTDDKLVLKRYYAAMIIQACASLRIGNILPSVTGDLDYGLSSSSFSFDLRKFDSSLFQRDHFLKLKNSKTGSCQTNFSRLGVCAAFFAFQTYGAKAEVWFHDLSYKRYTEILRSFVKDGQTHDLRRLLPTFAASVFCKKYQDQVRYMGNWQSAAYKLYSNEDFIALEALFQEFENYSRRFL